MGGEGAGPAPHPPFRMGRLLRRPAGSPVLRGAGIAAKIPPLPRRRYCGFLRDRVFYHRLFRPAAPLIRAH